MSNRLDEILGKLEGVTRNGSQASALCPAHEDTRPSLSLRSTTLGKIVLNCHAGCTPEAVVAALGLTMADLFPPEPSRPKQLGKPIAEYTYTDENGLPLYQVVRFDPKDFRVRRADPIGGWAWNYGGVRRVLYRLPEVIEAVKSGCPVYVVEGEKDVEAVRRAGGVATCNPGGAGKWRPEYTEALRGARVVIVADQDEPGQRHAADVARHLQGAAASVTVLAPASGRDAADHFAAGHGLNAFRTLGQQTTAADTPSSPVEQAPLPAAICALDAPPAAPVEWEVTGLVLSKEINLVVADGGVGKTTLALAIGGAVAGGYLAFDHPDFETNAGPVLIVSEEDPAGVLLNRLEALIAGHRWDREAVLGRVHLIARQEARLLDPRWQEHLTAEARRVGARLIVLDPLIELTEGDENSNTDQRPAIQFCRRLIEQTGAAIILVHHAGKVAEGKRKLDRIRGASAWNAAARAIYFGEAHDEGITLECLKLSRSRRLPTFVLERCVTEDPEQEGTWVSATLRFKTAQAAALDQAVAWVVSQLERAAERLNTTELKNLAKGTGISAADVSAAIRELQLTHRIDAEKGERGAKLWGIRLPRQGRQGAPNGVAEIAERLPGKVVALPPGCPAPIGATGGKDNGVAFRQGQVLTFEQGDAWEPEDAA